MNDITNNKINRLEPSWRYFPGFSLLFDNPGRENYLLEKNTLLRIHNQFTSKGLTFYNIIEKVRDTLIPPLPRNDYLFCALPRSSYHVTIWDGVNEANLTEFKPQSKAIFRELFKHFPISLSKNRLELNQLENSGLVNKTDWELKLKFKSLENWNNTSLVILLEPADNQSKSILREMAFLRKELNRQFQEEHGFSKSFRDDYKPHISIAYFANQSYGKQFNELKEKWNLAFQEALNYPVNHTLNFDAISLYGFTNMITFFKPIT